MATEVDGLRERWRAMCDRLGVGVRGEATFQQLCGMYSEGRHYHDLRHVRECLDALEKTAALAQRPDAVEAAVWFHDAVYDATRSDNEAMSAELAAECWGNGGRMRHSRPRCGG